MDIPGNNTFSSFSLFFPDIHKGAFLDRPNRFIVNCMIGKKAVRAYLPNPGRLWELFFPGAVLTLVKHDESYAV